MKDPTCSALQKPWTYKQAKTEPEDMVSRCKPGDTQKRRASPSKANPAGLLGTGGPSVRKSLQQTAYLTFQLRTEKRALRQKDKDGREAYKVTRMQTLTGILSS